MNLLPFYDAQAKFDRKLEEERELEECLRIPNKILAFYQELGELPQEMEWVFKDWKDRELCRDDKENKRKSGVMHGTSQLVSAIHLDIVKM